jgi:8-oxo-dGTP pyrophosphatase MutT (NUDIX family)
MSKTHSLLPFLVERSAGYFEYQLPISIKVVVDYAGKIPLLKNERDEWELPGGKIEVGEIPEECASREVEEELGLRVSDLVIIDSWVYEITTMRHVFIVSYGTASEGGQVLRASSEHKELGVFGYDEIPELRMPVRYKQTIATWRKRFSR